MPSNFLYENVRKQFNVLKYFPPAGYMRHIKRLSCLAQIMYKM